MGIRAKWHELQPIDRGIIVMALLACLGLVGVFLRMSAASQTAPPAHLPLGAVVSDAPRTILVPLLPSNRPTTPVEPLATLPAPSKQPRTIPFATEPSDLSNSLIAKLPANSDPASEGRRVAVIVNMNSVESVRIGTYYAKKRNVPKGNLILIHTSDAEEVSSATYTGQIEKPVTDALKVLGSGVDFLVFTKGVPIRIAGDGYSVDSHVATAQAAASEKHHPTSAGDFIFIENPYFDKNEPFSSAKYGFYLPCRLDGYTEDDAKGLVDKSVEAKPNKGPFLLDGAEGKTTTGYVELDKELGICADRLKKQGYTVTYNPEPEFISLDDPLEGYASWGSNDPHFNLDTYHKLKFLPGSIAETFVSTSARTFLPTKGGQSLIADLIQQGVTGVKGYVSEPYTFSMAHPSILFDRYTSGYNLAESFWMASLPIRWKEVVIGDPLCSPYHH